MTSPFVKCVNCGGFDGKAYWSDAKRLHALRRCKACGANARGPGVWLPREWIEKSVLGLVLGVDPHAEHSHGHAACPGFVQGRLF